MSPEAGESLVVWTARVAVACYAGRLAIELALPPGLRKDHLVRWVWSAGCLVFLAHMAAAFHFLHGWSHTRAWEHTVQRTAEVTGLAWGGGVYINYVFAAVWIVDAALLWRTGFDGETRATQAARGRNWWFWTVQSFFAFMMFNATVVFGPPFWRWAGPVVIGGLLWIWWRFSGRRSVEISKQPAS